MVDDSSKKENGAFGAETTLIDDSGRIAPDTVTTPPTAQKKDKKGMIATEVIVFGAALASALCLTGFYLINGVTGEQSKLKYEGDVWCVSNWVSDEDSNGQKVFLPDGRERQDSRLDGKEDWLRREQVKATNKKEAEDAATKKGIFELSDKTLLRAALDRNDDPGKDYFVHHFNTGATMAGPCWGSGDISNPAPGMWVSDMIRDDCFDLPPASAQAASQAVSRVKNGPCTNLSNSMALSESDISNFLKGSPLQPYAKSFLEAAQRYNVNPALLLAISVQESSLGTAGRGAVNFNPGNVKTSAELLNQEGIKYTGFDNLRHTKFTSWPDGIMGLAHKLNYNYLSKGRNTVEKMSEIYLEGDKQDWINGVNKNLNKLCK